MFISEFLVKNHINYDSAKKGPPVKESKAENHTKRTCARPLPYSTVKDKSVSLPLS